MNYLKIFKKFTVFIILFFAIGLSTGTLFQVYNDMEMLEQINRGLYGRNAVRFQLNSSDKADIDIIIECMSDRQILYIPFDASVKGVYCKNASVPFVEGSAIFDDSSSNHDIAAGNNILNKSSYKINDIDYIDLFDERYEVNGTIKYRIPTILDDFLLININDFTKVFPTEGLIVIDGNNPEQAYNRISEKLAGKVSKIEIKDSAFNKKGPFLFISVLSIVIFIFISYLASQYFYIYKKPEIEILNLIGYSFDNIIFRILSNYFLLITIGYLSGLAVSHILIIRTAYYFKILQYIMLSVIYAANLCFLHVNMIKNQMKKVYKKNDSFKMLIIAFISLVFILCNLVISYKINQVQDIKIIRNQMRDSNRYSLSDEIYGDLESEFFQDSYRRKNLGDFYNELSSWEGFDYYLQQYPWVNLNIPSNKKTDIFRYGYEDGDMNDDYDYEDDGELLYAVKAVSLNQLEYDSYNFDTDSGRGFENSDFYYKSLDEIPIIMGNEYARFYNVGDVVKGVHMSHVKFKIIGFLKEGEYLLNEGNEVVSLDRYIIIPHLYFKENPDEKEESFFYVANMLNNINGEFVLKNGYTLYDMRTFLDSIRQKYSIPNIEISQLSSANESMLSIINENNDGLISVITIILLLFSISIITLFIMLDMDKNKLYYAVNILCGADKTKLLYDICKKYIIIWSSSHIIAFVFLNRLSKYSLIWIALSLLMFIGIVPIKHFLNKIPVVGILKGGN